MNLNKVMLIGRLGHDPEIRYTQSGQAVGNFSLATSEFRSKSAEGNERTEWHRVVAWAKLAEFCQNYLGKGRLVYVEGRLQTREWQDKDQNKRTQTEIVASQILFMEKAPDSFNRPAQPASGDQQSQNQPPEQSYIEDDIPF